MPWIPHPRNFRRRIVEEAILFSLFELIVQGWEKAEQHLGWFVAALIAGIGLLLDVPLYAWLVTALVIGFIMTIVMHRVIERREERAAARIAKQIATHIAPGMEATIPIGLKAVEQRLAERIDKRLDQEFDGLAPQIIEGMWERTRPYLEQEHGSKG